jgi:hypothetical protein
VHKLPLSKRSKTARQRRAAGCSASLGDAEALAAQHLGLKKRRLQEVDQGQWGDDQAAWDNERQLRQLGLWVEEEVEEDEADGGHDGRGNGLHRSTTHRPPLAPASNTSAAARQRDAEWKAKSRAAQLDKTVGF